MERRTSFVLRKRTTGEVMIMMIPGATVDDTVYERARGAVRYNSIRRRRDELWSFSSSSSIW